MNFLEAQPMLLPSAWRCFNTSPSPSWTALRWLLEVYPAALVDATDFFLRDAHGVSDALNNAKQGSYKLDAASSAIAIDATKVFPKNTEVEAVLTFASDAPVRGSFVGDVAPDSHALTLREHHSFLELPP